MKLSYVTGFIFSVILTLVAYGLVVGHLFSVPVLIGAIMALALVQFVVQIVYFFHIGRGEDSRLNLVALGFMVSVVVIFVAGSLWIMANLNYNMSPTQVNHYLQSQDGI